MWFLSGSWLNRLKMAQWWWGRGTVANKAIFESLCINEPTALFCFLTRPKNNILLVACGSGSCGHLGSSVFLKLCWCTYKLQPEPEMRILVQRISQNFYIFIDLHAGNERQVEGDHVQAGPSQRGDGTDPQELPGHDPNVPGLHLMSHSNTSRAEIWANTTQPGPRHLEWMNWVNCSRFCHCKWERFYLETQLLTLLLQLLSFTGILSCFWTFFSLPLPLLSRNQRKSSPMSSMLNWGKPKANWRSTSRSRRTNYRWRPLCTRAETPCHALVCMSGPCFCGAGAQEVLTSEILAMQKSAKNVNIAGLLTSCAQTLCFTQPSAPLIIVILPSAAQNDLLFTLFWIFFSHQFEGFNLFLFKGAFF